MQISKVIRIISLLLVTAGSGIELYCIRLLAYTSTGREPVNAKRINSKRIRRKFGKMTHAGRRAVGRCAVKKIDSHCYRRDIIRRV